MRYRSLFALLFILVLVVAGCNNVEVVAEEESVDEEIVEETPVVEEEVSEGVFPGQRAPDFTLPDITDDEEFTLSEYKGRPVLIIFWASW